MARIKWNISTMNDYCNELGNQYIVLDSKYIDKLYQKQLWALVKCPNENHSPYWVCWNNFKKGYYCNQCFQEKNNLSTWTKNKAYDFFKENGYIMIDINDFVNVDTGVYCQDKNGFIFNISISNLKRLIAGKTKGFSITKNNKYAIYNIKLYCKLYRPDYEFTSSEFWGVKKKHTFKYVGSDFQYDENKRFFECTVDNFINGEVKHPLITMSKGECEIKKILDENNIDYLQEYSFKNCRDKKTLPFDFYIHSKNCAIEFQGKQHYENVDFFGGQKSFELCQKHDEIKNKYCKNNNIKLIRIPYWDFNNIEQILKDEQII